MSCKKSIKANHYLQKHEMSDLIDQLREAEDPLHVHMVVQLSLIFQNTN